MTNFNIYKNHLNKLNKTNITQVKNTAKEIIDTDSIIANFAKKIESFDSAKEALSYFNEMAKNNPNLKKLDNLTFKYDDYFFNISKKFQMGLHAENLQEIRNLEIKSAPEIIAYSELGNNADCVLITKIKNSKTSELVPYETIKSEIPIESKTNFLEELKYLCKNNWINMDSLDLKNWYVVKDTKQIIISDWTNLITCNNTNKQSNFINQINKICGLVYP